MPKEFYNRIVNEFLGGGNYGMQVQKKNVRYTRQRELSMGM